MCDAYLLWQHPSPLEPPVAVSELNSGRKRSCSTQGLVADFKDTVHFLWVVWFGRPFPRSLAHNFFAGVTICIILQTCFKWVCFLVLSYPLANCRALTELFHTVRPRHPSWVDTVAPFFLGVWVGWMDDSLHLYPFIRWLVDTSILFWFYLRRFFPRKKLNNFGKIFPYQTTFSSPILARYFHTKRPSALVSPIWKHLPTLPSKGQISITGPSSAKTKRSKRLDIYRDYYSTNPNQSTIIFGKSTKHLPATFAWSLYNFPKNGWYLMMLDFARVSAFFPCQFSACSSQPSPPEAAWKVIFTTCLGGEKSLGVEMNRWPIWPMKNREGWSKHQYRLFQVCIR